MTEKKIKVSRENFDELKSYMKEFLISEMEEYIKNAGSKQSLSLVLGREETYVNIKYKRAKRGSFAGLEKLWRECREKLLKKLTEHTSVDFTASNAYAVVLWAIKNANIYMDQQLLDVYNWMTRPENVQNYKSNERMVKDDWRYIREHTHYKLDYRLVLRGYNNFNSSSYGDYDYPKGLHKNTHDRINDMLTIAKNLGFIVNESSFDFQWFTGKGIDFTCQKGEFMNVRAYKNGNIHVKANQEFMKRLNIEAGRLNGWVKSPEEAAAEMNIPVEEVRQMYKCNLQIAPKNVNLLQIEQRAS